MISKQAIVRRLTPMIDLEDFWGALLSKDAERIRKVWARLSPEEALAVRAHLERMASGDDAGYGRLQSEAAAEALRVIDANA